MPSRVDHLRAQLAGAHLPGLIVTSRANIQYLSGFTGSSGALIVTPQAQVLVSDFRYVLQAAEEAPAWTFVQAEGAPLPAVREQCDALGLAQVGVEAEHLTLAQWETLGGAARCVPTSGLVERLRLVKEPAEVEAIRAAVRVTDDALDHLLRHVAPGVTERELALEAEWSMRRQGAQGVAFDIIVAAGAHSALPHAQPGDRALQPGDLLVIDMGARVGHYCSDMTRTVAVAEARPEACALYDICLQAQLAGLAALRAGVTGHAADRAARAVIEGAGYGAAFGHGTGHGVGLEIHEAPRLRPGVEDVIPAGAVVTVEPGIYVPAVGGVRIEDLVVVTEAGIEILTGSAKPASLPVYG